MDHAFDSHKNLTKKGFLCTHVSQRAHNEQMGKFLPSEQHHGARETRQFTTPAGTNIKWTAQRWFAQISTIHQSLFIHQKYGNETIAPWAFSSLKKLSTPGFHNLGSKVLCDKHSLYLLKMMPSAARSSWNHIHTAHHYFSGLLQYSNNDSC